MFPFSSDTTADDSRLMRMGYGAASPLWAPFLMAAGMGVGFYMLTAWTRRSLAMELPGAGVALRPADGADATAEAPSRLAEPMATDRIDAPGQAMAHTPPPAGTPSEPLDTAPAPAVPVEEIMDHAPPESVDAPANDAVERRIETAPRAEPAMLGGEPGGKAALLAETSAAVLGETASFGGDMRADDAAEPSLAAEPTDDDAADLVDAAYAANFGPVVEPTGLKSSRKRRVPPGTAPV